LCFHAGLDEVNNLPPETPYFILPTWSNKLDNEVNGYGVTQEEALKRAKVYAKNHNAKIDKIISAIRREGFAEKRVPVTVHL
jgi:hypothetical protein